MTDIAKYEIGRLRPHFMDVCRPNVNCSLPENEHRYFENFKCLGTDIYALREMRFVDTLNIKR
jgi:phosphatidate phosphatase